MAAKKDEAAAVEAADVTADVDLDAIPEDDIPEEVAEVDASQLGSEVLLAVQSLVTPPGNPVVLEVAYPAFDNQDVHYPAGVLTVTVTPFS